jgi:hypothetical protein
MNLRDLSFQQRENFDLLLDWSAIERIGDVVSKTLTLFGVLTPACRHRDPKAGHLLQLFRITGSLHRSPSRELRPQDCFFQVCVSSLFVILYTPAA